MYCELDICIYNKKHTCTLDEVHMNVFGMCDCCEIVTVPAEILEELKRNRLAQIHAQDMPE